MDVENTRALNRVSEEEKQKHQTENVNYQNQYYVYISEKNTCKA